MPTQILKSEFPPADQWEEMEIVECIGTDQEHADTFLRWNNYGIEIHDDGLCQAYVIIQTDEGEIPKKVAEGFNSPEAVIEYFRATEGQKALTEGEAPVEEGEVASTEEVPEEKEIAAEAEKEPSPAAPKEKEEPEASAEKDPKDKKDDEKPIKKMDDEGTETYSAGIGNGEQKAKQDQLQMDKAAGVDGSFSQDMNKEAKGANDFKLSATEDPEPLGEFPVIKSWADMQAEYNAEHNEYQHPISYYQPSAATVRKTQIDRKFSDKNRKYPVDTIDHDPVEKNLTHSKVTHPNPHPHTITKSIQYGEEIPSWADMQAGYSFQFPARAEPEIVQANPIAKATPLTAPPSTDEQIEGAAGNDLNSSVGDDAVADEAETITEGDDGLVADPTPMVSDLDPEKIAAQLQMDPEQLIAILGMEGGIEAVASALQGDNAPLEALISGEGAAPAPAEVPDEDVLVDEDSLEVPPEGNADGAARISLQSEPTDTI